MDEDRACYQVIMMSNKVNYQKLLAIAVVGVGAVYLGSVNGDPETAYTILAMIGGYIFGNGAPLIAKTRR